MITLTELYEYVKHKIEHDQKGIPTYCDNTILEIVSTKLNLEQLGNFIPNSVGSYHSQQENDVVEMCCDILDKPRFQSLETHLSSMSVFPKSFKQQYKFSQGVTECISWKSEPIFKTVYELSILQMLLWDIKPKTIIEVGTGLGGSARYMRDIMSMYGLDCKIITLDIQNSRKTEDNIEFYNVDCNNLESFPAVEDLPHPWLVIEDSHVNVRGVIQYYLNLCESADYIIVEDACMLDNNKSKIDIMLELFKLNPQLKLDTKYMTFFGYNDSCNETLIVRC